MKLTPAVINKREWNETTKRWEPVDVPAIECPRCTAPVERPYLTRHLRSHVCTARKNRNRMQTRGFAPIPIRVARALARAGFHLRWSMSRYDLYGGSNNEKRKTPKLRADGWWEPWMASLAKKMKALPVKLVAQMLIQAVTNIDLRAAIVAHLELHPDGGVTLPLLLGEKPYKKPTRHPRCDFCGRLRKGGNVNKTINYHDMNGVPVSRNAVVHACCECAGNKGLVFIP